MPAIAMASHSSALIFARPGQRRKIHALRHAVFSRRRARVVKRQRVDVRRNGAFNAPVLQKPHGKIPMVGADVGQSRALRHKACNALQPRLKL